MTCNICGGSLERGWRTIKKCLAGIWVQHICLLNSCYEELNKLTEVSYDK